jgi:imidazolonepropionase
VGASQPSMHLTDNAALIVDASGVLTYAGPADALTASQRAQSVDLHRALVTPAFVDCHTHAVFAGNRAGEFAQRLSGASYAEIAAAGGGIMRTARFTQAATEAELVSLALPRLLQLKADGVAALEIKSGYGLTLEAEAKMLRAAGAAAKLAGMEVQRTFLGLHALPADAKSATARAEFVRQVCQYWLPELVKQGLVDAVDAFMEHIAFNASEVRQFFSAAQALNVPIKLHAEQLSNLEGAVLAAEFNALSADHLEHLSTRGVNAMRAAKMTAVLLPGAFYCLKEKRRPPIAKLRKAGVPLAIATDLNPGTSPMTSLRLAMHMACIDFDLTLAEALAGTTHNAARALGWRHRGQLAVGQRGDFIAWQVDDPAEIIYWLGGAPVHTLYQAGIAYSNLGGSAC